MVKNLAGRAQLGPQFRDVVQGRGLEGWQENLEVLHGNHVPVLRELHESASFYRRCCSCEDSETSDATIFTEPNLRIFPRNLLADFPDVTAGFSYHISPRPCCGSRII